MISNQRVLNSVADFSAKQSVFNDIKADFALVFADKVFFDNSDFINAIQLACHNQVIGCSTSGEIHQNSVSTESAVVSFITLEHPDSHFQIVADKLTCMSDSFNAGARLGKAINQSDLACILLFGKGVEINGSALIEGLKHVLGTQIPISGGLAGDAARFESTLTLTPQGADPDGIVALCLYGENIITGHSSVGGWKSFGPARLITKNDQNILYELDGQPALDVYKKYLGEYAKDLPASGLLFPFEMVDKNNSSLGLIRTILGIDENKGALILAGSIEQLGYLRLMQASADSLVDGAEQAAIYALNAMTDKPEALFAILVSCVGRRLVMNDLVEEEVEAIAQILPDNTSISGFYSYGEMSPFSNSTDCKLHNQTMTVTLIGEGL